MALVLLDRAKETTIIVGTGSAILLGATTGFQSFAGVGTGNTTYYCIADQGGANWEVGIGTYTLIGTTLARTTVLASSNAGALVSFAAGTKDVFITYPSEKGVWLDASGNVLFLGSITALSYVANGVITGSSTTGVFSYGTLGYSDVNHATTIQTTVNSYVQTEIQNTNVGAAASADHIVTNNLSTATTYYGDFGINSSGWVGTGAFNTASMVYLTATTGDLAIGTTTANAIHFVVNNGATDALTIASTGAITSPNAITAAQVLASNGFTLNNKVVAATYTFPTGYNAVSTGPITINSGVVITVPSTQRWVVL